MTSSQQESQATELKGQRVSVRPMRAKDLDAMAAWRPFADPLYQAFDFPRRSLGEHKRWFEWRSRDRSRRLYAIEDERNQVIGSLTLREIDGRRSARLGITIGADFVSQGYGSEALRLYLEHYFRTMRFAQLVLDVAATNLRAVRTYRTLGFRQIGQHYRPASHSSYRILRQEPRYSHLHRFFRRQGTVLHVLFYDMAMSREEWWSGVQRTEMPRRMPGEERLEPARVED
jgi:RimJ/RimL family protein N-acetyltransferase